MEYASFKTGQDYKASIIRFTEDNNLGDSLILDWINQAVADYPVEANLALHAEYTEIIKDAEYELPINFGTLISVHKEQNGAYIPYKKQVEINKQDKIIFPEGIEDTMRITYYPFNGSYSNLDAEIPIRPIFRLGILYYALSEYYAREGEGAIEEHRLAQDYYGKYLKSKQEALEMDMNRASHGASKITNTLPKTGKKRRAWFTKPDFHRHGGGDY